MPFTRYGVCVDERADEIIVFSFKGGHIRRFDVQKRLAVTAVLDDCQISLRRFGVIKFEDEF